MKKRENYRKAFDNFDVKKIAKYDEKKVNELLCNKGIIRNKAKCEMFFANSKGVWKF